jgi:hypothetical protein
MKTRPLAFYTRHEKIMVLKGIECYLALLNGKIDELAGLATEQMGDKIHSKMNYPAAELRSIKMNFYLLNPDAEHRGILLIKGYRAGISSNRS